MALAMSAIYICESITELPLISALVRLDVVERSHLDTAFTIGVIRGLLLASILVGISWPLSIFYNDHRLIALTSALALAPAVRGTINPNLASDMRAISFWRYFTVDSCGKPIAACVSALIALETHSYWAIASYTILSPAISTVVSFCLIPYRPHLSLKEWPAFKRFIGWNSAGQVLAALNWQFDRILLGRSFSKPVLGRYVMANDIAALPEMALIKPIMSPLMAGFVLAKGDVLRLKRAYLKANLAIFSVGLPVMLGISALAAPAVRLGLGPSWIEAIPLLKWLALSCVPPLAAAPMAALAASLDRPEFITYRAIIESFVRLPLLVVGVLSMGLFGVIYARLISDIVMSIVSMAFIRRLIGVSVREQLKDLWRSVSAGAAMYIMVSLAEPMLSNENGLALIVKTAAIAAGGAIVYFGAIFTIWWVRQRPPGLESDVIARLPVSQLKRFVTRKA